MNKQAIKAHAVNHVVDARNVEVEKRYAPIPVGAKKYRFNGMGQWVNTIDPKPSVDLVLGRICIFECIATTPAKAQEKFGTCVETLYSTCKAILR